MKKLLLLSVLAVSACSNASTQTTNTMAVLTVAVNALPCYEAVKAGTTSNSTLTNVLTGVGVMAANPACAAVDAATVTLINDAVAKGVPVVAAPVVPAPAPAPAVVVPAVSK
jgi:hypothetical protein